MSFDKVLDYLPGIQKVCRGLIFVTSLFFTAFGGFIFFAPLFVGVFAFKITCARWIVDTIISTWFAMAVGMYELVLGVKIVVKGDVRKMSKNTCSLLVMNHRTRLDWLFLFSIQARYGSLRRFKISLKDELKHVPGPGWAMQAAKFMFLKRNFAHDRQIMESALEHFSEIGYCPQLLLFPEGTDFQSRSLAKSISYAKKNDLPEYEYVLHPRTTGFTSLLNSLKLCNSVDQIVDVTISYPQNILQSETDLIYGDLPREIVFKVDCFDIADIPSDNEPLLARWLEERWRMKEEYLRDFYALRPADDITENGFSSAQNVEIERDTKAYLIGSLLFWTVQSAFLILLLTWSYYYRIIFCCSIVVHIILSVTIGFDNLFMYLWNR